MDNRIRENQIQKIWIKTKKSISILSAFRPNCNRQHIGFMKTFKKKS